MNLKHKLYLNRLLSSWGDRTWDFAIGLFLVKVYPTSLLLAAIQGILASSAVIIFAPIFGRWIEKASRIQEVKICLFIQNGSVVMSSAFVALYFSRKSFNDPIIEDMISSFAPFILVTFSVIAQVTSAGYTLCLEKDWLLALARDEAELTDLNAMLRRLDLCCQTIAPFLVGILMQHSELGSALFLLFWNFFSGFSEYAVLKSIYNMGIPSLLKPKDKTVLSDNVALLDVDALKKYKKSFLLPGIACGLAYLSILGFDSVTIGYITNRGPEEGLIGIFSLLGAIFGIMGTIMFQWLAKSFSLRKAGLIGFIIDLSALSLCLWVVQDFGLLENKFVSDIDLPTLLFLIGIAISRAGIWTIDLSMNQMIQVETSNPPLIGGVQTSVNIFSELTKFILVAFLPALSSFWILILVSYFSITIGFIIFLIHIMTDERQIESLDANEKFTYGTLNECKS